MAVQQEILDQLEQLIDQSDGVTLDLGSLPVMNPQTTQRAIKRVAQQLPHLTTLNLWGNQIGDAGALAIAEAIRKGHWPDLKSLWLGGNDLPLDQSVLGSYNPQLIAEAIQAGDEGILPAARIMFVGMGAVGKSCLAKKCFLGQSTPAGQLHEKTPDFELVDPNTCMFKPKIELNGRLMEITPYVWDLWPAGTARVA